MSSSKKVKKMGDPDFDPYELLGLEQGVSDAEITKAYRKLALQLHPDKQQNLSPAEQERVAADFHALQEARSFLLDADHAEERRAYDTKRASQRLRREQDKQREKHMSERRKRMRDELRKKEMAHSGVTRKDEDLLDKLRKEGSNLRERHSQRVEEEQRKKNRRQSKKARIAIEERQVRLKWSRSRIQVSPSEHSLAQLLSKFGPVESVEMIGSKGNSALVTFENASSCRPCVDAFADSDEMRGSFVGKRKEEYEEEMLQKEAETAASIPRNRHDYEDVEERKLRQAEERQRLARQMEMEDDGQPVDSGKQEEPLKKRTSRPFPLEFSDTDSDLSALKKLERFEDVVLGSVLSPERMQQIKIAR